MGPILFILCRFLIVVGDFNCSREAIDSAYAKEYPVSLFIFNRHSSVCHLFLI